MAPFPVGGGGDSNSDHRDPEARELVLSRRRRAEAPPGSTRLGLLGLLAVLLTGLLLAACTGETFVEYRGAVVRSQVPSHTFAAVPNPDALPPVPGAEVTLTVCSGECRGGERGRTARADAQGEWGPLDIVFGGGLTDHEIRIEVTAPGYVSYVYEVVYERTTDPTAGDRWLTVSLAGE